MIIVTVTPGAEVLYPSAATMNADSRTSMSSKDRVEVAQIDNTFKLNIALDSLSSGHVPGNEFASKAERRLVRKIDAFIIPFICITYLMTYIDKAALSYGMYLSVFEVPGNLFNFFQLLFLASKRMWTYTGLDIAGLVRDSSEVYRDLITNSTIGSIFYFGYLAVCTNLKAYRLLSRSN